MRRGVVQEAGERLLVRVVERVDVRLLAAERVGVPAARRDTGGNVREREMMDAGGAAELADNARERRRKTSGPRATTTMATRLDPDQHGQVAHERRGQLGRRWRRWWGVAVAGGRTTLPPLAVSAPLVVVVLRRGGGGGGVRASGVVGIVVKHRVCADKVLPENGHADREQTRNDHR